MPPVKIKWPVFYKGFTLKNLENYKAKTRRSSFFGFFVILTDNQNDISQANEGVPIFKK